MKVCSRQKNVYYFKSIIIILQYIIIILKDKLIILQYKNYFTIQKLFYIKIINL